MYAISTPHYSGRQLILVNRVVIVLGRSLASLDVKFLFICAIVIRSDIVAW